MNTRLPKFIRRESSEFFLSISPFDRERGTSTIELAVICPTIFIMLIMLVEFSNAIYMYSVVSSVAYETTRYAAVVPALEAANCSNVSGCADSGSNPLPPLPKHAELHDRLRTLLDRQGISLDDARYQSNFISAGSTASYDTVQIDLDVPYRPLLFDSSPAIGGWGGFSFSTMRLRVHAAGPYLIIERPDAAGGG